MLYPAFDQYDTPNRRRLSYLTSLTPIIKNNHYLWRCFQEKILAFSSHKTIKLCTITFSGNQNFYGFTRPILPTKHYLLRSGCFVGKISLELSVKRINFPVKWLRIITNYNMFIFVKIFLLYSWTMLRNSCITINFVKMITLIHRLFTIIFQYFNSTYDQVIFS